MADRQGVDLFSVQQDGKGLDSAVGYLLDATKNFALADKYRVAGTVCNHPAEDPQHTELYTSGYRNVGLTDSYSAWIDLYLRRFPNHPRRSELLALFDEGVEKARPMSHALVGGPASCIAASTFDPEVETLFDRAERMYPQLFSPAGRRSGALQGFQYRYYPGTGNYVGVHGSNVYYLAPGVSASPVLVGPLETVLKMVK
jgi:hypothetical protein